MKSKQIKKQYTSVLSGALFLLVFYSCGVVTNNYKSPEVDTSGMYGSYASEDTITIASIPWKEYFNDSLLINLIEEGLKNNYDLQLASSRIKQAEANLSIAKNAYFPGVSLVGQVNHNRTSPNGKVLNHQSTSYTLGISTNWELDVWGKLQSQSRSQYAALLNSYEYRNLVQTSLISNIATSYYTLIALDEQLSITSHTANVLKNNVEALKEMKEAFLVTAAAVEQGKTLLYTTEAKIPDLEMQVRQTENALNTLLGRKPTAIERSSIEEINLPEKLAYGVPAQMLARRPDVKQAELAFRSAFELTNVSKASLYPTIALNSGSIGYQSASFSNFFLPENIFASILGGLTQPLFAKGQLKANLKIANARQEEALLNFENKVLGAGQEVSDILIKFDAALRKKEIRIRQIESSKKAVDYTWDLLKAGVANYTEVLSAEQSLLSSELNRVSDLLQQLQCSVDLYRALGGGTDK